MLFQRRVRGIHVERLLAAALDLPPAGGLKGHKYHCLFGLLSVTGLRISEAPNLALEAGAPTKTHILNLLHRLVDGKSMDTPAIKAPQALVLTTEPQVNVERYDALRKVREARHAS